MHDEKAAAPDNTAVRVALWRALHAEVDSSRMLVFEIDQPGPQVWKRQRLVDLGFGIPSFLRLVPVDFDAGDAWAERLAASGFDAGRHAGVLSVRTNNPDTQKAANATRVMAGALLVCRL